MRETEKRQFRDEELVKELIKKAQSDFGIQQVSVKETTKGILLKISNEQSSSVRRQHKTPEYLRKVGD